MGLCEMRFMWADKPCPNEAEKTWDEQPVCQECWDVLTAEHKENETEW